jgi:hypothetical protein
VTDEEWDRWVAERAAVLKYRRESTQDGHKKHRLPVLPPDQIPGECGTSTKYGRGCKCDECRAWKDRANKRAKERRRLRAVS